MQMMQCGKKYLFLGYWSSKQAEYGLYIHLYSPFLVHVVI